MSRSNLSRSAALTGLANVARELGVDIAAVAAEIGVPPEALSSPDLMIPSPLIGQLYGRVSQLSGVTDLSLRIAERRLIENMGVVGFAMSHQPTLLAATEVLRRHFGLQNEAVGVSYVVAGDTVEVQVFNRPDRGMQIVHLTRFSAELAIGVLFRALNELSETPLRPLAVSFVHARGAPMKSYLRVFGIEPAFEQDSNNVILSRMDMVRWRSGVNPRKTQEANIHIETISARGAATNFLDGVHDLLIMRLRQGLPTVREAAELLAMSPRTLNRRLAGENTTYQELIQQIRLRAAASYLEGSSQSLAEISSILGFAGQSGFSRWFHNSFGVTPSEYRRAQKRRAAN